MVTIQPVSETYLMIYVGEVIDPALMPVIRDLVAFLHGFPEPGIIEVIRLILLFWCNTIPIN